MANHWDLQLSLGDLADEYEIIGELGRGGISIVYLARERELGREVALKVIRDQYLHDPEAIARFEREARTLAQLEHPNVVTLYSARRLAGGSLVLVMQLTHGHSLRQLLRRDGPFSFSRAEQVLCDIASALAYLHGRGVIHRDIKPENIFFDERRNRTLLSDFGIAKALDGLANVTLTGVVVGTPAYMSPEQIDGAVLHGQSDLYSLGLVGWELLTGQQPWKGENLYSIIVKQKTERLPSLEALRPGIPEHLRLAIERALEKERGQRWSGAEQMLAQLEAVALQRRPPAAPPALSRADAPSRGVPAPVDPVTIEFRPPAAADAEPLVPEPLVPEPLVPEPPVPGTSLPEPVRPSRHGKRRTPVYLAAAAVVPVARGTATIPLINTDTPAIHTAGVAEVARGAQVTKLLDRSASAVPAPLVAPLPPDQDAATSSVPSSVTTLPGAAEPAKAMAASPRPAPQEQNTPDPDRRLPHLSAVAAEVVLPQHFMGEPGAAREAMTEPLLAPLAAPPGGGMIVAAPERAPVLQNEARVLRLIRASYPTILRDGQVGGTVLLGLLIDKTGSVVESQVTLGSGYTALDALVVRVARQMKFRPAQHQGQPVQTWRRIPLTFDASTPPE